ncbi:putative aspartyl aminopeptidase [Gracilariopsis chorda]|uniref:aspartyl aminopeptidase n=1 Tax=Gracilariopsis chorda TaxID=448386 RepID=A0A2V3IXV6_9FLOR|nr:putative aspartyl aminopeptidase [Gracilariopsis chorda]|eukprot:PXF46984.1 putative aspartyl aminopeptidase [Gracilariopsis chorda]
MGSATKQTPLKIAQHFLQFNDNSRSPFHAVQSIAALLKQHDFHTISESDNWASILTPGGRYVFTRNASSIVAFSLPNKHDPAQFAFNVIGAHTDSPCFKVKPVSDITAFGYLQVGVECYGGGLWHTWFDRDLTVAGRVVLRSESGKLAVKLISVPRPILRIPNLAIHLSRNVNTDGFKPNKETDTKPILATQLAASLNQMPSSNGPSEEHSRQQRQEKGKKGTGLASDRHAPLLLSVLAEHLQVRAEDIVDIDLCVADTQPCAIGGALNEFVFAPRLDNLASCFTATRALIAATKATYEDVESAQVCRMMCCFDHEEIGSKSSHGADSPLLDNTMQRICEAVDVHHGRVLPKSLLISVDMAHAIHPNYSNKHENNHRPALGAGLVVKTNQNQRYATSGISGLLVREAARRAGNVAIQEFVVPNDKPCGSTIGPLLSSRSGLRTVDVGQAQLSMHSVREMCSVHDFALCEQVFEELLKNQTLILNDIEGMELA